MRNPRSVALMSLLALSFGVLPGLSPAAEAAGQPMSVGVGAPALQFSLPAINEDAAISVVGRARVSLADLDGRDHAGVVLYFFSRQQGGAELAALSRIQKRYGGRGVVVLGVCTEGGELGPLATWIEEQRLSFPILHDSHGVVASRYGVPGLPLTVLIDSKGNIFAIGRPDPSAVEAELDAEVAAMIGR